VNITVNVWNYPGGMKQNHDTTVTITDDPADIRTGHSWTSIAYVDISMWKNYIEFRNSAYNNRDWHVRKRPWPVLLWNKMAETIKNNGKSQDPGNTLWKWRKERTESMCVSLDASRRLLLIIVFFSCGSTVLWDPGRLRRFLELFRHMVGLLGRVISSSQGLYLHRTTQHKKTLTNIHALSGIRTHNLSN
jgi:hypothetical protein